MELRPGHPALSDCRSIHTSSIRRARPGDLPLMPGSNIDKLGGRVTVGDLRGARLMHLALEERKTCPPLCPNWRCCYGNNSPFIVRWAVTPGLYGAISVQLDHLDQNRRVRRSGTLLRLHSLGDFPSLDYVQFWDRQLGEYPWLHVYGHTHRTGGRDLELASYLGYMRRTWKSRWAVRQSDPRDRRVRFAAHTLEPADKIIGERCPHELGLVKDCGSCALCWDYPGPLTFVRRR